MRRIAVPVLFQISLVHLISHVHALVFPALLPLLPLALDVDFLELGAAISLFNVTSALVQAPLGFAADRFGARRVLMGGLCLGSLGCLVFALHPTYAWLLAVSIVLGAANGVYHPADYAILARSVSDGVMGRAFSLHSFAGYLGSAVTPASLTAIAAYSGIPAAVASAGVFGLISLVLMTVSDPGTEKKLAPPEATRSARGNAQVSFRAVLSGSIVLLTALFALLSLSTSSIERFSVSAFIQGYAMELLPANTALTVFLVCSAAGVLCGGLLADRTERHGCVAAGAYGLAAVLAALVAVFTFPAGGMVFVLGAIGFLTGIIVPSRDMLVRAASPAGSEGKVFGIVSTGFNIGGTFGPILFGWLLDHHLPRSIFWCTTLFMAMTVILTVVQERRMARKRKESTD